ncbi:MAG: ATP-binding protein [Spirochaetia bacterium]|nr:ATP-binding protein [Spirochaetia bacterium]
MILERLCYDGDIKKIKEHIASMLNSIPESEFIMFSNNQFLNSILNHYNQLIAKEQISFKYSIKIKDLDETITPDICIILANALENAIEACTKSDEKTIELNIIEKNNSLFISIKNTFNPKLIKLVDDKIQTTKKDIDNHGLGLKIIDNITLSHGGNSLYIIEDNIFRLDIWINLIK